MSTFDVAGGGTATYNGIIAGRRQQWTTETAALPRTVPARLVLSGASTYTGLLYVPPLP